MRSTTMLPVKFVTPQQAKTRVFAIKMAFRHGLELYREIRRKPGVRDLCPGDVFEIQSTFRIK